MSSLTFAIFSPLVSADIVTLALGLIYFVFQYGLVLTFILIQPFYHIWRLKCNLTLRIITAVWYNSVKGVIIMVKRYTGVITKEEKWYVANCLELGVVSQGKTVEEAQENLQEAVTLYRESFGAEGVPEGD